MLSNRIPGALTPFVLIINKCRISYKVLKLMLFTREGGDIFQQGKK